MVANFVVASEDSEGVLVSKTTHILFIHSPFQLGLENELREAFRLYDKEVCCTSHSIWNSNFIVIREMDT